MVFENNNVYKYVIRYSPPMVGLQGKLKNNVNKGDLIILSSEPIEERVNPDMAVGFVYDFGNNFIELVSDTRDVSRRDANIKGYPLAAYTHYSLPLKPKV